MIDRIKMAWRCLISDNVTVIDADQFEMIGKYHNRRFVLTLYNYISTDAWFSAIVSDVTYEIQQKAKQVEAEGDNVINFPLAD